MTNAPFEATPRNQSTPTSATLASTQWFALHYAEGANPTLPRTVFASTSTTSDDGKLRFMLVPAGRAPYAVFEVPVGEVLRCTPHEELRAAVTDAFGEAADSAA